MLVDACWCLLMLVDAWWCLVMLSGILASQAPKNPRLVGPISLKHRRGDPAFCNVLQHAAMCCRKPMKKHHEETSWASRKNCICSWCLCWLWLQPWGVSKEDQGTLPGQGRVETCRPWVYATWAKLSELVRRPSGAWQFQSSKPFGKGRGDADIGATVEPKQQGQTPQSALSTPGPPWKPCDTLKRHELRWHERPRCCVDLLRMCVRVLLLGTLAVYNATCVEEVWLISAQQRVFESGRWARLFTTAWKWQPKPVSCFAEIHEMWWPTVNALSDFNPHGLTGSSWADLVSLQNLQLYSSLQ